MRLKVSSVCQFLDKSKYPDTTTHNGIIWTNNGDGTITTTGNANNLGTWLNISNSTVRLISNRKYLLCGCPSGGTTNTYWLNLSPLVAGHPVDVGGGIIFTPQETSINHPLLQINPNLGNNLLWKPQLYDLTEMYGAGNEPTTVAQFRQDFPEEMYEYSPECWKRCKELRYRTETKNLLNLDDYTISWVTIKNNTIRIKKINDWQDVSVDDIFSPLQTNLKSDKYYRISAKVIGEFTGRIYKFFGKSLFAHEINNNRWQGNFTLATIEDKYGLSIIQNGGTTTDCTLISDEVLIYDIMLEESDTAFVDKAEYVPYGYLPLRRGKYIMNKEPVQLLDKSKFPAATSTSYGITYTKNEDGSYDVNGTTTRFLSTLLVINTELKKGHWYLNNLRPDDSQKSYVECKIYSRDEKKWIFPASRFKLSQDRCYSSQTLIVNGTYLGAGVVISNEKLYPELFDLTEMYGEGNEPTEQEFWATYLKTTMYEYNPYSAITFR